MTELTEGQAQRLRQLCSPASRRVGHDGGRAQAHFLRRQCPLGDRLARTQYSRIRCGASMSTDTAAGTSMTAPGTTARTTRRKTALSIAAFRERSAAGKSFIAHAHS